MSTPPIQSSDVPGYVELPQDAGEPTSEHATSETSGEAGGESGGHPHGPHHPSQHGDFYHANRMQQQLQGGGTNGTQPHGAAASQSHPQGGGGPHGGNNPRTDGTPRGEGHHRGGDGPRGNEGPRGGDGPRGNEGPRGDGPYGQQRPGHGPDGTQNGHSPRNAYGQPGNNVLPGNPSPGNGRQDGPQMPPWAGVPGMGASSYGHGGAHGGGLGALGSLLGNVLGLLGGTGGAVPGLLRLGDALLPGTPFHPGAGTPNGPAAPPPLVDALRGATQVVTQALPGANGSTATTQASQPSATMQNDAVPRPRTPLPGGAATTTNQGAPTTAHEANTSLRGFATNAQQGTAGAASTHATLPSMVAARNAVAADPAHAPAMAANARMPPAESTPTTNVARMPHGGDGAMPNAQATAAANATRAAPAMQALQAIQPGALTLAFAPQMPAGLDEGTEAANHTALFRGQGADGQEGLRDILGRSYVFSADGKLVTRADERREVDPVQASRTEAIDEHRFANDGELSTHELVWKVVVPAFVGVGTLLGGAAVGAATAAGSTGMAGAFLLVAAASIFGYGAVRAGSALREMADAGQRIHPLENAAARTQWLAAGSQSLGSLASLALLLV